MFEIAEDAEEQQEILHELGDLQSVFFFRAESWEHGIGDFNDFFTWNQFSHEVTTILAFAQPQPCAWCFRVWILGPQSGVLGIPIWLTRWRFFSDLAKPWGENLLQVGATARWSNLNQLLRFFFSNWTTRPLAFQRWVPISVISSHGIFWTTEDGTRSKTENRGFQQACLS